jgi:hypothetical protein
MPRFETVPMEELKLATAISERKRKSLEAYMGYVDQLTPDTGGRLICDPSEKITTVRNDLKQAAGLRGKDIVVRRSGNVLAFYLSGKRRGRRGRKKE